MTNPANPYLNQTLAGRYRLVSHIGDGNFSHVFKATDQQAGDVVAVKILIPDAAISPEVGTEFKDEGVLLGKMSGSENVVQLLDSGQSQLLFGSGGSQANINVGFHVLELADGALSARLTNRQGLDWHKKMRIFRDAVMGVHQMHEKRIAHRDVKASNVLLFGAHKRMPTAKVSDLGRSRDLGRSPRFPAAAYTSGRGDLSFAPPEYIWNLATGADQATLRRADIYLLGSVLFEIATGVGITSATLPEWKFVLASTAQLDQQSREASFRAAGRDMASSHEIALGMLADEVPREIEEPVVNLVRQMCDPDPARREHRFHKERRNPVWGLQWVIRRVDIIIKTLERADI